MLPQDWYLSSTGHEQSGVKLGSPLPKALEIVEKEAVEVDYLAMK
jgi:hypothetical protein